jgi:hypothetical protein
MTESNAHERKYMCSIQTLTHDSLINAKWTKLRMRSNWRKKRRRVKLEKQAKKQDLAASKKSNPSKGSKTEAAADHHK